MFIHCDFFKKLVNANVALVFFRLFSVIVVSLMSFVSLPFYLVTPMFLSFFLVISRILAVFCVSLW